MSNVLRQGEPDIVDQSKVIQPQYFLSLFLRATNGDDDDDDEGGGIMTPVYQGA